MSKSKKRKKLFRRDRLIRGEQTAGGMGFETLLERLNEDISPDQVRRLAGQDTGEHRRETCPDELTPGQEDRLDLMEYRIDHELEEA